ncbi:TATA-binding protein-associated factor 2N-like [Orussus abietinus]|uniref:TATA-binding protein-associated factor 2N-like n=1 Tax=Orussus abietinus TaxID=222816 RepID=UPI000C71604E|nr:TATA-binding protein-associated factor 2N-like [Orussus abietinus]
MDPPYFCWVFALVAIFATIVTALPQPNYEQSRQGQSYGSSRNEGFGDVGGSTYDQQQRQQPYNAQVKTGAYGDRTGSTGYGDHRGGSAGYGDHRGGSAGYGDHRGGREEYGSHRGGQGQYGEHRGHQGGYQQHGY